MDFDKSDNNIPNSTIGNWFSATSNPAKYDEGLYDWCVYCLSNFKKFYPMVNNMCQSCGRVADPVRKDKQENISITSVNADMDSSQLKAISMEMDYSPLMNVDPTSVGLHDHELRMTAKSAGEAMRLINSAEQRNTITARAAELRGAKYIVKTNVSKDKDKLLFDNNK